MDQSKMILIVLAVVGAVSVIASVSRSFWYSMIAGGPIVLGLVLIAAFLAGVFVGRMR